MKLSIFSFLLISVFSFTSCNKSNDLDKKDKDEYKNDDKKECFDLVYPVTYILPDGSTETVTDDEDWAAIKSWYEDHPDVAAKPVLQYPVEIIRNDHDAPQTINNEEEMIEAKKGCDDKDWEKELCFEFVYPLTYTMPDDSEISGDDEESLWTAIKAWYEDHPDVAAKPVLQYPVEIIRDDHDAPQTINNEEEMIEAKEDCED